MGWIRRVKHEIFDIEADMELGLNFRDGFRRGGVGKYIGKESGVVW